MYHIDGALEHPSNMLQRIVSQTPFFLKSLCELQGVVDYTYLLVRNKFPTVLALQTSTLNHGIRITTANGMEMMFMRPDSLSTTCQIAPT